jgi:hypothetical protein
MKIVYKAVAVAVYLGALGAMTLQAQTNTAYGTGSLGSNTTGYYNAAFGYDALTNNTTGSLNTATGYNALYSVTTAGDNTATGALSLQLNSSGVGNTATGSTTLSTNTTGNANTGTGYGALSQNTSGYYNTATGYEALASTTTPFGNTGDGFEALSSNTIGYYNIAVGFQAGSNLTTGWNNIEIGNPGTAGEADVIRIGSVGTQQLFYAAGIDGVSISEGVPVYINSVGQMGTANSSIRYKEDVHDMADASNKLFQLRPVTYRYKQAYADGSKPIDYGLIAEEVAQVYPDMVARTADGQIQTVQYQKLTPMLLNEVQKQHRQLETQQHAINALEQRLSTLEASLDSYKSNGSVPAE